MLYLLTGENTFELERRLKSLVGSFDGEVERVDGEELEARQLPDLLAGATLFSTERLVVLKNLSQNKPVWTALVEWLEKGIDNDVIFVEPKPDKRTKTFKLLEKQAEVTTAGTLRPYEAVQWLQKEAAERGVELSRSVAEFLCDYVGADQWRLSSELEKLRLAGEPVTTELIRKLVEPTPQTTSFELLDAALAGRTEQLQKLFDDVSQKEDAYMFFGLLSGQLYALALLQAANGRRPEDIAKEAGVHPFVLKKSVSLARSVPPSVLKAHCARLAELDANMKSRQVEPWTQVYSFLLSLNLE